MAEEKVFVNYKERVEIPKGTVLSDSKEQQWMVGASLDFRGSLNIYTVAPYDDKAPEDYTSVVIFKPSGNDPQPSEMQSRICDPDAIDAWKNKKQLRHLGVTPILGAGHCNCDGKIYSYIITQRYTENLKILLAKNKKGFIPSTVYKVIGQMIHALEYIHSYGYYGFYINGTKLLQGFTNPSDIYLDVIGHGETPECLFFNSRDVKAGTAVGDLENVLYIALYFMNLRLPWKRNSMDESAINQHKIEAFNDVDKFLLDAFGKYKILAPIRHIMNELASTSNDNKPDYQKIRSIISKGIRNVCNVNDNIDSSVNFTKELKLRKCSHKAGNKNSKNIKTNTVSKKTQSERNQVKHSIHTPVLVSNCNGLAIDCHQIQSKNIRKSTAASSAKMNVKTKTADTMTHVGENSLEEAAVALDNTINAGVDTIVAQDSRETSQDDTPEMMMTCRDPSPILSFRRSSVAVRNVTTMPTEKNTRSKITESELPIIGSAHLQRDERENKLTESEGNRREDTMAEVMQNEETKGSKKQQLTIPDVSSEARASVSNNEPEEDPRMSDSVISPGWYDAGDDADFLQWSEATSAIQPPDGSELPMVNSEVQLLKRELELCEGGLALGDDSGGADEDPKLLDRVDHVAGCITDLKADFFNSCHEIQQELGNLKGLLDVKPVIEVEREQHEKPRRSQSKIDRSPVQVIILESSGENEVEPVDAAARQQDAEPLLRQSDEVERRARTRDNQLKEVLNNGEQSSKDRFQEKSKGKSLKTKNNASSDSDCSDIDKARSNRSSKKKRKLRRRTPSNSDALDSDCDSKKMEGTNFNKKNVDGGSTSRLPRGLDRKKFETMTYSKKRQNDSESDSSLSRCNKTNNEFVRIRRRSQNQDYESSPIRPSKSIDNSKSHKDSKYNESRSNSDFNPSYRLKDFKRFKDSNDYHSGFNFKNSRQNKDFGYRKTNYHFNFSSLRSSENKSYRPEKYFNPRPWSRYGNYHSRPWQNPAQNRRQNSFGWRNYRNASRSPSRNRRWNSLRTSDSRSTSPASSVTSSKAEKKTNFHERSRYSAKKDKELKRPEEEQSRKLRREESGSGQTTVQRGSESRDLELNPIEKKERPKQQVHINEKYAKSNKEVNHGKYREDRLKKESLKVNKPLVDYTDDEDS